MYPDSTQQPNENANFFTETLSPVSTEFGQNSSNDNSSGLISSTYGLSYQNESLSYPNESNYALSNPEDINLIPKDRCAVTAPNLDPNSMMTMMMIWPNSTGATPISVHGPNQVLGPTESSLCHSHLDSKADLGSTCLDPVYLKQNLVTSSNQSSPTISNSILTNSFTSVSIAQTNCTTHGPTKSKYSPQSSGSYREKSTGTTTKNPKSTHPNHHYHGNHHHHHHHQNHSNLNNHHPTGNTTGGEKKCKVCGGRAINHNFGQLTCESCKAFFRRNAHRALSDSYELGSLQDDDGLLSADTSRASVRQKCLVQLTCTLKSGEHEITPTTRRECPACRLKVCFRVGMRADLIQTRKKDGSKPRWLDKAPSAALVHEQRLQATEISTWTNTTKSKSKVRSYLTRHSKSPSCSSKDSKTEHLDTNSGNSISPNGLSSVHRVDTCSDTNMLKSHHFQLTDNPVETINSNLSLGLMKYGDRYFTDCNNNNSNNSTNGTTEILDSSRLTNFPGLVGPMSDMSADWCYPKPCTGDQYSTDSSISVGQLVPDLSSRLDEPNQVFESLSSPMSITNLVCDNFDARNDLAESAITLNGAYCTNESCSTSSASFNGKAMGSLDDFILLTEPPQPIIPPNLVQFNPSPISSPIGCTNSQQPFSKTVHTTHSDCSNLIRFNDPTNVTTTAVLTTITTAPTTVHQTHLKMSPATILQYSSQTSYSPIHVHVPDSTKLLNSGDGTNPYHQSFSAPAWSCHSDNLNETLIPMGSLSSNPVDSHLPRTNTILTSSFAQSTTNTIMDSQIRSFVPNITESKTNCPMDTMEDSTAIATMLPLDNGIASQIYQPLNTLPNEPKFALPVTLDQSVYLTDQMPNHSNEAYVNSMGQSVDWMTHSGEYDPPDIGNAVVQNPNETKSCTVIDWIVPKPDETSPVLRPDMDNCQTDNIEHIMTKPPLIPPETDPCLVLHSYCGLESIDKAWTQMCPDGNFTNPDCVDLGLDTSLRPALRWCLTISNLWSDPLLRRVAAFAICLLGDLIDDGEDFTSVSGISSGFGQSKSPSLESNRKRWLLAEPILTWQDFLWIAKNRFSGCVPILLTSCMECPTDAPIPESPTSCDPPVDKSQVDWNPNIQVSVANNNLASKPTYVRKNNLSCISNDSNQECTIVNLIFKPNQLVQLNLNVLSNALANLGTECPNKTIGIQTKQAAYPILQYLDPYIARLGNFLAHQPILMGAFMALKLTDPVLVKNEEIYDEILEEHNLDDCRLLTSPSAQQNQQTQQHQQYRSSNDRNARLSRLHNHFLKVFSEAADRVALEASNRKNGKLNLGQQSLNPNEIAAANSRRAMLPDFLSWSREFDATWHRFQADIWRQATSSLGYTRNLSRKQDYRVSQGLNALFDEQLYPCPNIEHDLVRLILDTKAELCFN